MSDALTPLRHAYGVEPTGAPAAPGDVGHPEQEALRQVRDLLDTWPATAPRPEAVAAVEARATVVAATTAQTDRALAQAFASRPQPRPSGDVLAAVLARAAEPVPDTLPASSHVEAAVFDQSLQALDRLPAARPDVSVIAAVEARAAEASDRLGAVRHVYLDAPAVAFAEAEALRQSRAAVEQALTSRPQPRPSEDAVAAILARAAEASGVEREPAVDASAVEGALLSQSLQALDRLPRPRPSTATLDAVRMAAAAAGTAPPRDDRPARSPDRAPSRPMGRRTPVGVWAGAAGLLVAALAALVVLPFGGPEAEAPTTVAAVADTQVEAAAPTPVPAEPDAGALATRPDEAAASSVAPAPLAAAAALPGLVSAAPQTEPSARSAATLQPVSAAQPIVASAEPPAARTAEPDPPSWEMSEDVRALSLRLQEINSEDDLAWDDVPAEAFGAPTAPSVGSAPGLQSVRAGAAPARTTPARARLRTDSSSVQR